MQATKIIKRPSEKGGFMNVKVKTNTNIHNVISGKQNAWSDLKSRKIRMH